MNLYPLLSILLLISCLIQMLKPKAGVFFKFCLGFEFFGFPSFLVLIEYTFSQTYLRPQDFMHDW